MNCNIIRNNSKSESSSTNNKSLLDKNYNRLKYRIPTENNNVFYQAYKYPKFKKFNKRLNDSMQTNGEPVKVHHTNNFVHEKFDSSPFKYSNGEENFQYQPELNFNSEHMFEINKKKFNITTTFNTKSEESANYNQSNATNIDQKKSHFKDNSGNLSFAEDKSSMLKKAPVQDENANSIRSEKRKYNQKWNNNNNKKQHEATRFVVKPDEKQTSAPSVTTSNNIDKNGTKLKLNFLQESQLTSEQLSSPCKKESKPKPVFVEFVSDTKTRSQKNPLLNGLNPSAVEFTPCGTKKYGDKSPKFLSSDSLDNGMKVLTLTEVGAASAENSSSCQQSISNPMVLDDGSINAAAVHNPFAAAAYSSFYDHQFPSNVKVTLGDLGGLHQNICPFSNLSLGRTMSALNYTPAAQTIVPQFQVALYGAGAAPAGPGPGVGAPGPTGGAGNGPHLIRYNPQPAQNVPINLQGSYFLYSPVMINNSSAGAAGGGLYNSLLPANHHHHHQQNRLFSMDIPAVPAPFAHPHHQSFFQSAIHSNNSNNNHIFAESISNSTSSTSHLIR